MFWLWLGAEPEAVPGDQRKEKQLPEAQPQQQECHCSPGITVLHFPPGWPRVPSHHAALVELLRGLEQALGRSSGS